MTRYVAFLRGINSGQHPTTKMETLRQVLQDLGFRQVKTILASGNVLFEAEAADEDTLAERIEAALPEAIGFQSDVIIRTISDLRRLVEANPFRETPTTPHTRPYVTFVKGKPQTRLAFPVQGQGYTILGLWEGTVCSVVDLAGAKTPDLMQALDKAFGKRVTTRSWNTVERIARSDRDDDER